MAAWKVLLTDGLEENGQSILRESAEVTDRSGISADELLKVVGEYDALIVRGRTKVTAAVFQAGTKLKVVGRAGVGVRHDHRRPGPHRPGRGGSGRRHRAGRAERRLGHVGRGCVRSGRGIRARSGQAEVRERSVLRRAPTTPPVGMRGRGRRGRCERHVVVRPRTRGRVTGG